MTLVVLGSSWWKETQQVSPDVIKLVKQLMVLGGNAGKHWKIVLKRHPYFQQSACSRPLMGSLVACRTPSLFQTRTFLAPLRGQTALTANNCPSPRHVTRGMWSSQAAAGCTSCVHISIPPFIFTTDTLVKFPLILSNHSLYGKHATVAMSSLINELEGFDCQPILANHKDTVYVGDKILPVLIATQYMIFFNLHQCVVFLPFFGYERQQSCYLCWKWRNPIVRFSLSFADTNTVLGSDVSDLNLPLCRLFPLRAMKLSLLLSPTHRDELPCKHKTQWTHRHHISSVLIQK